MTRSDGRRARPGFTLIELLVALMVGAAVVLGARLMLEGVADDATRITHLSRRVDDDANAERVLRATVSAIDVGSAGSSSFDGDEHTAHFASWCARADGWQERCAATLTVTAGSDAPAVVVLDRGTAIARLRTEGRRAELRYLVDAHDGGRWLRRWDAGLTTPLAIGVVLETDTLVLVIGERG